MSCTESQLSNKPKQCILTYFIHFVKNSPVDYNTDEDANPETAEKGRKKKMLQPLHATQSPRASSSNGGSSKRGEAAKKATNIDETAQLKKDAEKFRKKLAEGIEIKKFATSSRFRAKPSARTLWLETRSQTIYWQKGKKNPSKIKTDASLRLSDIVKVTEGMVSII